LFLSFFLFFLSFRHLKHICSSQLLEADFNQIKILQLFFFFLFLNCFTSFLAQLLILLTDLLLSFYILNFRLELIQKMDQFSIQI
jgi:hypothetical protein